MNFSKVKYSAKDKKIEIQWETLEGAAKKDAVSHSLVSFDPPHPDFRKALEAIIPGALKLLELPTDYAEDLMVRGITFAHVNDEEDGAVVTMLKELTELNAPLVLNTPLFAFGIVHGLEERFFDRIRAQARDYMTGKREQMDLFRSRSEEASPLAEEDVIVEISAAGHEPVTMTGKQFDRAVEHIAAGGVPG